MEESMAQLLRVLILESEGAIKARPAYAAAAPPDRVRFVNLTPYNVTLQFIGDTPFDGPTIVLGPHGSGSKVERVVRSDAADGRYAYRSTINGQPLLGESDPEIIIDR